MPKPKAFELPPRTANDAAALGDIPYLKTLLEANADAVHAADGLGVTPLHTAAVSGQLAMVQFLVEHGADVNALTYTNNSPLHCAAAAGSYDIVHFLVEKNANVAQLNADGACALELAKLGKHSVIEVLLKPYHQALCKSQTVFDAAVNADIPFLSMMALENPSSLKATTADEDENLLILCCKGIADESTGVLEMSDAHVDALRFLLQRGVANVNASGKAKLTPIMLASRVGKQSALQLLLEFGADPTMTADDPTQSAATMAKDDLIQALVTAAAKEKEFNTLYSVRNSIPMEERPAYIMKVKIARQAMKEARKAADIQLSAHA